MEKLIELLNEYAPEDFNWCEIDGKIFDKSYEFGDTPVNFEMGVYVISKQFGFIKWLVDNDKIDLYKAKGNSDRIYYKEYGSGGFTCSNEEFVLMLLSISDTPIDDLISYLK